MSYALRVAALAIAAAASQPSAHAAGAAPADTQARVDQAALYRQECGACHTAFAPRLLPPASWNALMNDLPHHFRADASVEPATQRTLTSWLVSQGAAGRARPEGDRITRSGWFGNEHSEFPADVWSRPSIKSPSNCGACHASADSGVFDEHDVRIPR
jgi:mono/diheme cytochrome c family protein